MTGKEHFYKCNVALLSALFNFQIAFEMRSLYCVTRECSLTQKNFSTLFI